jgi:hypothetical protein
MHVASATWLIKQNAGKVACASINQLADNFLARDLDRQDTMCAFQRSLDLTTPLLAHAVGGVPMFGTD